MDFRCPNCQKELTVPDEYAGQLMKCPLCQNTFQAPALPPPVNAPAAMAPLLTPPPPVPGAEVYGVVTEPSAAKRAPEPPTSPITATPPPPPPQRKPEPPPLSMGDFTRKRTLSINPHVVSWVTPLALLLLFVLSLFTWGEAISGGDVKAVGRSAWGWGFGEANVLTLLYLLVFLVALLLSAAIAALRLAPNAVRLPSALRQLWPWRSAVVALLLFLSFFFLVLQLVTGFKASAETTGGGAVFYTTSGWAWLALLVHLTALVAALLDFWLELRGPGRPAPRVDISW